MTIVLYQPEAACPSPVWDLVDDARQHRPEGTEDLCAACEWHWPCPAYTQARLALIRAGVPPAWWAAPRPVPGWSR